MERYNPLSNQWESRRLLSLPRFFSMLAPLDERLFLFGGATLDNSGNVKCVRKVEYYIPSTDSWVGLSQMLDPRAEASCAVQGNKIYVVGGYSWDTNSRLSSVEVYDVEADTWVYAPPIDKAYTGVGCCSITLYHKLPEGQDQQKGGAKTTDYKDNDTNVTMRAKASTSCPKAI